MTDATEDPPFDSDDSAADGPPPGPGLGLDEPPQPAAAAASAPSKKDGEAYRVLARKYRPSNFAELIGQEALVRTLTNAIEAGASPRPSC